jgi:two-component system response regulator HydG
MDVDHAGLRDLAQDDSAPPASSQGRPSLLVDGGFVGGSKVMRELAALLAKVADSETTVLVTGESGTGKELVARVIHRRSRRAGGPFIAVNCAAVPETLLETELFGHVRGAFTHASADKKGLFVQASRGTLFLDEVAEIPLDLQAKLLRSLQERKVRPVGAAEERDIDVRLVAATNKNLETAVREGRFREDLFFRVNVVQVEVPPLRDRGDDVLHLARHFVRELASFPRDEKELSDSAADALLAYDWPGNVRELYNYVARAMTLADGPLIRLEDLPEALRRAAEQRRTLPEVVEPDALPRLSVVERRYIHHVLERLDGNKTRAAEVLGIDRRTLHRKLKRMRERGAMH